MFRVVLIIMFIGVFYLLGKFYLADKKRKYRRSARFVLVIVILSILFKPRSGMEIYTDIFEEPKNDCVKVFLSEDAEMPIIDCNIMLEFKTCPQELKRILKLHEYKLEIKQKDDLEVSDYSRGGWFKPESLGKDVLVFTNDGNNGKDKMIIYASTDSTNAFFIDWF